MTLTLRIEIQAAVMKLHMLAVYNVYYIVLVSTTVTKI